ncbi:hypothetical protein GCM10009037_29500 [Halarchaeum grantii]|uniref:Uncharacterized protein n=1 Tax=Halarchaeum grantii TaxID=1193105 RepID=A0A830F5Y9_9EURY|nr:hypothetical protein [Halarchaeum grantii]GGL44167.1 hypothetical protein GCM10009037_29500 [Halarchaeum grantii]
MGLSGTIDSSVYEGLKDVLRRYPTVTTVAYEPDSIVKKFLRAQVDPNRVFPPTGPDAPTLDVEWRFTTDDQYYRIHYADPNTGFNCGWHRDDDHPELGPVHFQYENPVTGGNKHERANFEKELPTEVLWTALDRLFDERLPDLTDS